MKDDRYQHSSRFTKVVRWLTWKPLYAAIASFRVLGWLLTGAKPWTIKFDDGFQFTYNRRQTGTLIYVTTYRIAEVKMKYYYTTDEMLFSFRGEK